MASTTELKRSLSLVHITLYGLGTILGAGIYVLVGKVAGLAGLYAPISFILAAALAALTGLSYAELSARFPKSAGEAVYVQEGLGVRALSKLVGGLIILAGVVSSATIAKGFVGYLQVFLAVPDWMAISLLILILGGLAAWGISESVLAASIITVAEVGGLLLILFVAGDHLAELPARLPELIPTADSNIWLGIVLGSFLAFYAFIGFEDIVNVAEEVKNPKRNLPLAIIISIVVSSGLYILVALVAVMSLPLDELSQSRAPLALIYERATGAEPWLISLISIFAVVNGALIQIIMATRVLYGMSREGWLHSAFGEVHAGTQTPLLSTAVSTVSVLVLALWLPLVTLANLTSFVVLIVFALINLSLVRIKRREPAAAEIRQYPIWIPMAGFLSTLGFVLFQLYQSL